MQKQLVIMGIIVVLMFGFCYALVPIYNVFCKVTGLNGKTVDRPQPLISKIDQNRTITIELLSMTHENPPVMFTAGDKKFSFHPGEYILTHYTVKNLTDRPMVVQAIPSVSPNTAANHIKKIECFCFQKQYLEPNETLDLPLKFTVDPVLSSKVNQLTLAYTLFDITDKEDKQRA